jgi:hypothetical protein
MKLKINLGEKTIERDIVKKEESIYGICYTLQCGWFVDYDKHFNRWEITTLKKGEYIGRFQENDIKQIG